MYTKSFNSGNASGGSRRSYGGRSSSFGGGRSYGGRPQRSRGGPRRNKFSQGQYIDPSKFINKAVITEEVEYFVPEHKFEDFLIDASLKKSVVAKGYLLPTPIQDKIIPHILKGADVVGVANTGTGKTAAFLIPLINKILLNRKEQVLIIVPTRELAVQINDELKGFVKNMKIFSACCFGGSSIGRQIQELKYFNNFVIGTPGRLKDLINRKHISLEKFNTIVLDEADRMLDMGFVGDMRFVVNLMPKERHSLFFSATITPEVEKLIKEFLREPVRISVKTRDTSKNIDQDVVKIQKDKSKVDVLHELLVNPEFSKVLIFGRTKHGVEQLSKVLNQRGIKTESIHGNKNQGRRQRALDLFKRNGVQALIATDVAARGLDISDVSHVINFDIPATYDDYIHRIGRTGRANKLGKALTFIE